MNSLYPLVAAVLAVVCVACTPHTQKTAPTEQKSRVQVEGQATKEHACCSTHVQAGTAMSDASIYQLGTTWTDMNGKTVGLADLRGKIRVAAMIFTNCAYVCPRITTDMRDIEAQLAESARADVGFVVFSIDPERDTPQALAGYARKMELDPLHWTLLRSDEGSVRELAAVLGVKYKKESNGDFSHSILITVLNREGEIAHRQEGLGQDPRQTLAVINSLIAAQ